MPSFKVKVKKTFLETQDVRTIIFEKIPLNFKAGQFVTMFLDVKDPKGNTRSFSIASSPTENFLMISTKLTGSVFKNKLNELKEGDEVKFIGPAGNFVFDEKAKNIILLSGGIGITPLRSMMKYATDNKLSVKITLLYSNKIPEDIPFKNDLENMKKQNTNLKIVHTITKPEESKTKWLGRTGRIDEKMISEFVKKDSIFYICGPPAMVDALVDILKKMNIAEERIRVEHFEGY
jgi:ferredoxin-NADP reductase